MNQVNNKKPKKNNEKPSALVVNPVFTKPRDFMKHFAATKKPSLSLLSQQPYQPNYKYATPMVDRSSLQATTSAASGSNEFSRKVSFGRTNCKEATSSSTSYRPAVPSLLTTTENFSSSKPTTSCSLRTPISTGHDKNPCAFTISYSSQTKGTRVKATPRSTSSATTATSNQSRVIVAITEGRGNACGQVGLAAMDVRRPCLIMCQLSDIHNYHNTIAKLNVLNPSVLLFPNTIIDNQKSSKLLQRIEKKFPTVNQQSVHRKFYNDQEGMHSVKSLHLPECSSIELLVVRKYFMLAAAAALVKYVEYIENVTLASGSVPMEYQSLDEIMMIDFDTMHNLELILSHSTNSEARSLFGVLNQCFTFGGKKRLRSAILQPSVIENDLNARLDCVMELVENPELRHNIQNTLGKIPDIESLLKICFIPINLKSNDCSVSMMNYIILLKTTLDVIPSLYDILHSAKTKHFEKVTKCLTDPRLKDMASEIDELFDKDTKRVSGYAASQFQRCFAIKPGINGLLDVARYTYSELITEFQSKVAELSEEHQLPLKCQNTSAKGFHITLDVKGQREFRLENLPKVFIQARRNKNVVTMTTENLIFMNERINQALQEVQLMNNAVLQELLQKIREKTGCLYNICDKVAELDVIVSLSRISSNGGYIRPIFGSKLVLKSARHPILDFMNSSVPIGNDVTATDRNNFHIITGPNMGGKSIYIKQIALIQIMAQIGCYVPAVSAEVKLMDHLFSRISFDDSIECNSSHFTLELKEMEHILRTKTKSSLVIIDEFCRGTASDEGTAVAWATSEEFIDTTVYVFFATHFHFLTKLQDLYLSVSCWYFDAEIIAPKGDFRPRLHFTHKLLPGVVSIENYGLKLAESTALPEHLKEAAHKLAENLSKTKQQSLNWHVSEQTKTEAAAEKLVFKLRDMAQNNQLSPETLAAVLAECDIAAMLSSEERDNHREENVDSQDNNAAKIITQQSGNSDENYDSTNLESESNMTGDATVLDSEPETVVCSAVRSHALESLKQYESFDSTSESEWENMPKQFTDESCSEESIKEFTAGDDDTTFEYKTREILDVTSKTADSSFSGFAMVTPQNHSSTPINPTSWNSQRLNDGTSSVDSKLQGNSQDSNDKNGDMSLHSFIKRLKRTDHAKDGVESSLLPHCDETLSPKQTGTGRRFSTPDVSKTGSTIQETPANLTSPPRNTGESDWHTSVESDDDLEKMDCNDDKSIEQRQSETEVVYDESGINVAKPLSQSPVSTLRTSSINKMSLALGFNLDVSCSTFEVAGSSQPVYASRPSVKPNLHNVSWTTQGSSRPSYFERKNVSRSKFNEGNLNASTSTAENTSFDFQRALSDLKAIDQTNQEEDVDHYWQLRNLSRKFATPSCSQSVSSPFIKKLAFQRKQYFDLTNFIQLPQQSHENPTPPPSISPNLRVDYLQSQTTNGIDSPSASNAFSNFSEGTLRDDSFRSVDTVILSQEQENLYKSFEN